MKRARLYIIGTVMFTMLLALNSSAQSTVDSKESARVFVQQFYDWYSKIYAQKRHILAHLEVLTHKPQYLDMQLLNALLADDRASEKRPMQIIGLGFDPFTNTLDARKGFQTGMVIQKGNKFLIDIHDIRIGRSKRAVLASKLVLTAEVVKMNGHFVFDNFIYPKTGGYIRDGNNLLNVLDSLHKDRVRRGIEKI
ncbi:MAG: hypothetical protein V4592_12855 [Bacteroidota bacterium]